ncbi:MAG: hypothetical protein ACK486_17315 [Cyanobacteriota bacterium]
MAAASELSPDLSPQLPSATAAAAGVPDSRQLDLLRIVCCVAWADGEVSEPERQLLAKLTAEYFLPAAKEEGRDAGEAVDAAAGQLAAWAQDLSVLDEVIPRLRSEEDRLLAIKLAYMMASIGRQPGDSSPINQQEKLAYRRLVEGLGVSDLQVQEAEWAADQDLAARRSPWAVLGSLFGSLGAWPPPELLESPVMTWL